MIQPIVFVGYYPGLSSFEMGSKAINQSINHRCLLLSHAICGEKKKREKTVPGMVGTRPEKSCIWPYQEKLWSSCIILVHVSPIV